MKIKLNFKVLAVILLLITLLFLLLVAYFKIKFKDRVLYNTYLGDLDISLMTYLELKEYLEQLELDKLNVSIVHENTTLIEIDTEDIGYKLDSAKTVNSIIRYGNSGNVFTNFVNIIKSYFKPYYAKVKYTYSENAVQKVISKMLSELPNRVTDDSYFVQDNTLTLTKGNSGVSINKDKFTQDILNILTANVFSDTTSVYEIDSEMASPKAISVDEVYNYIRKEAKDATKREVNGKIIYTTHEYGVDIDKNELQKAINDLSEDNKTVSLKLKIIEPAVKLGDLKADLYSDLLGTYTTRFALNNENRNSNIKLAASFLDGVVIIPGEIFSFNKTVGNSDLASRGFKESTIYANGGLAQGIGGGVCQVSSTLYMAALYSNLEIVERYNHAFTVSYLDPSFDATIAYPYLDLKFKNTRSYPIKLVVAFDPAGKLTISMYGTQEELEYDVSLESETLSITEFETIYAEDPNLEWEQQVVKQTGQKGCTSKCYKILSLNGETISKTLISTDRYIPLNKIVSVSVKNQNNGGNE